MQWPLCVDKSKQHNYSHFIVSEIRTNFTNPSMYKKGQRNTLKKAVVPNTLTLLQHVDFMTQK